MRPEVFNVDYNDKGWKISIAVTNSRISASTITWIDPACDHQFLKILGTCLVGMTLRQARDHGLQQACMMASKSAENPSVQGILLPVNFSKTSRMAEIALRQAIDGKSSPDPAVWNFDDIIISESWRSMPLDKRVAKLSAIMAKFLSDAGFAESLEIVEIDVHERVFVTFLKELPPEAKPPLLMSLERHVRQVTGERIEFFLSEMKDKNRIRRL